jgi:hypothetical protein
LSGGLGPHLVEPGSAPKLMLVIMPLDLIFYLLLLAYILDNARNDGRSS